VTQTVKGFEFANLQAGGDFKVADHVGVGPFVSFSLGEYSSVSMDPEIAGMVDEIPNKAIHEWLVIGVKGSFNF